MRTAIQVLIGLLGIFNLGLGLAFLFNPVKLGAAFFLSPVGSQGLATLRADFPGFFIGASLFALHGAYHAKPDALLVPLVLLAIAFSGRVVSLIFDGRSRAAFQPMSVEIVMMVILLLGYLSFGA